MCESDSGHRGEREISRKTIARGMPDVSGVTVVTNACAFYHCTRGCGRAERPAFPALSVLKRVTFMHSSGAIRAARSRRRVLRCLAIQSIHVVPDKRVVASAIRDSTTDAHSYACGCGSPL